MDLKKQRGQTFSKTPCLILASASPRRKQLLEEAGFPYRVVASGIEENVPADLSARETAMKLALDKAREVSARVGKDLVVGADTLIALEGEILGKPEGAEQARTMLRQLQGRAHSVITGLAVVPLSNGHVSGFVETFVKMRDYTWSEIEEYVSSGEPFDKAGSYAIQGKGGNLVEGISGCYNNIVGLPLCRLVRLLTEVGVRLPVRDPICRLPSGAPCPETLSR